MIRYAIQDPRSELYVHTLAPHTNPSATPERANAKTWAQRSSAQAAIRKYALTYCQVVEVTR